MAADLATLELRVERTQVEQATRALGELATKGGMAGDMARRIEADYKSGAISAEQYSAAARKITSAMTSTVPPINSVTEAILRMRKAAAQSGADAMASQLARLDPFQQQITSNMLKMDQAAGQSVPGLAKVERAMSGLAFAAAGVPGPIGSLAGAILQLGVGGLPMIGMIAAAGLLGLALNKMGEGARKTAEELKGVRGELEKLLQTAAGQAQLQKGILSQAQSAREAELTYRYALLETATRADNAKAMLFQQERIAELLNQQTKDAVRFGQAQKIIDDAHQAAIDRVAEAQAKVTEKATQYQNALRDAMVSAAKLPAELAKSVDEMLKAADAADRFRMTFTPRADLQRLGLVGGNGIGNDVIEAETQRNNQRLRDAGMLVEHTIAKVSTAEKTLLRDMQRDFADFFDDLLNNGLSSFAHLFDSIRQLFTKLVADLAAQQLMKKITTQDAAGNVTGMGGNLLGMGAAGGPLLIGAVLSAGMVVEHFKQAAALAKEIAADFTNLSASIRSFHMAAVGGADMWGDMVKQAEAARALAKQLRDDQLDAMSRHDRGGNIGDAVRKQFDDAMKQIDDDEKLYIARLIEEQRLKKQYAAEDLAVRYARALGHDAEADAMALANTQHREYAQAVRDGATAAELAYLGEVQLAEARRYAIAQATAAAEKEMQVHVALRDAFKQTTDTLRGYAASLRVTAGSPVQNYAEARKQFDDLAARARTGDQEAARQLPEFARQFLDLSRGYNASGMGYQNDFKYVMGIVDSLGDKFSVEQQLMQQLVDIDQKILDTLQGKRFSGEVPGGGGFGVYGGGTGAGEAGFGYQRPVQGTAPGGNTSPILFAGFTQMHDDMEELKVAMGTLATAVRRREAGPMVG